MTTSITPRPGQEKAFRQLVEGAATRGANLALKKGAHSKGSLQRVLMHGNKIRRVVAETVVAQTKLLAGDHENPFVPYGIEREEWEDREHRFLWNLEQLGCKIPNFKLVLGALNENDRYPVSKRKYVIPAGLTQGFLLGIARLLGLSTWSACNSGAGESLPTEAGLYNCTLDRTYAWEGDPDKIPSRIPVELAMSAEEVLYIVIRMAFDEGITPPLNTGWCIETRNLHHDMTVVDNVLVASYSHLDDKGGLTTYGIGDTMVSEIPKCFRMPRVFIPL